MKPPSNDNHWPPSDSAALQISQAVTPLRMIFWGGLLCVLDLSFSFTTSVNGQAATGFRFDILNDLLGMLLITIGVSRLAAFAIDNRYVGSMRFIGICCILGCIEALLGHFIFPPHPALTVLLHLLGLASLVAVVMFCNSMHRLAFAYALPRSADSWLMTRLLVVVIWGIPLGLVHAAGLAANFTGQAFSWNLGLLFIPILLTFLLPLIHLFISTSRMRHEIEQTELAEAT